MPRICGLDIETTGLDRTSDHVTELAWVIKDTGDPRPLVAKSAYVLPPQEMWNSAEYVKPRSEQLTKIKMAHLMTGQPLVNRLAELIADVVNHRVDYVVAHNGENFDKPFLKAKAEQQRSSFDADCIDLSCLFDLQWIDSSADVTYPEDCRHTNLMYVAAYYGFVNPFPHCALFDVMTMLRVLDNFDIEQVAERARIPWTVIAAKVSYDQRELAKARRYCWETLGDQKFPKTWVKKIKETELEKEKAEAPFDVIRVA